MGRVQGGAMQRYFVLTHDLLKQLIWEIIRFRKGILHKKYFKK